MALAQIAAHSSAGQGIFVLEFCHGKKSEKVFWLNTSNKNRAQCTNIAM